MTGHFADLIDAETRANVRRSKLLAASFAYEMEGQRYDSHVRRWAKHMQRQIYRTYFTDPEFAAAHDAQVRAIQSRPLPAWGGSHV